MDAGTRPAPGVGQATGRPHAQRPGPVATPAGGPQRRRGRWRTGTGRLAAPGGRRYDAPMLLRDSSILGLTGARLASGMTSRARRAEPTLPGRS